MEGTVSKKDLDTMKWTPQTTILLVTSLGLISPVYASASLNHFVRQIVDENPSIQAAISNVLAAKARGNAAGKPLYNPEFTAEKQKALDKTSSLGINQTIDWTDKRSARAEVGTANLLIAEAQLLDLRQQLSAQILSALAKYQSEQQILSLAKERSLLLQAFVRLTEKRLSTGDVARVDLDLAQLALSEALSQEADAAVNLTQTQQMLYSITGLNHLKWPRLSAVLPKLTLNDKEIDQLMDNIPSFLIVHQQYQTARARIKLAEKERFPDPTIGFQSGKATSSEGERKRFVGLTVNIPLFVRNPYKAEVEAANYEALEAEGKRKNIVRQIRAEIKGNSERYQTLFRATQQWLKISGRPLNEGMQLIERLWQAGEISTTDYLVQLKQRVDSEIAGIQLKGRAWEAWTEWLRASGQVENWLQSS